MSGNKFCPTCDQPYPLDRASICQSCEIFLCDRCVDKEGLCVECRDEDCGVCEAEREPDYDAPSFAESHESAYAAKRAAR